MRLFSGQRAWLLQRASALVLLVLLALGGARVLLEPPTYAEWRALASSSHGAVLIVACFAALGLHGWIGARDVILDYVHAPALRLALLGLIGFVLIAVLVRVVLIVAAVFEGA